MSITSPDQGATFTSPATITITVNATDADGTVLKVEFYDGAFKIGESSSAPFTFDWTDVNTGSHSISAIATDNQNATGTSASIIVQVSDIPVTATSDIDIYPNPTSGSVTLKTNVVLEDESSLVTVVNSLGKKFFEGNILKDELTKQFDFSYLDRGVYIVLIKGNKGIVATAKFVKM
ncbi:MAG: Ig-like domain-containing protein [Bacteroidales bacterium]